MGSWFFIFWREQSTNHKNTVYLLRMGSRVGFRRKVSNTNLISYVAIQGYISALQITYVSSSRLPDPPFDFIDEIEHMAGKQNLLASKQNLPYWTGSISRLRGCAAAEFAQSEGRNNFSTHTHILFKQSYSFSNRKRNSFECVHSEKVSSVVMI